MTRDELIENIRDGEHYRFADLPQEYLDKDLIMEWLDSPSGALSEVPKHLVDDDIRRHAFRRPHEEMQQHQYPLKAISMSDTSCYEDLALLALEKSEWNMEYVDPAFHSEAFFLKALEVNPQSMLYFMTSWTKTRAQWTDAMINSAVSKSLDYLPFFGASQVKKESLERLINEAGYTPVQLANAGLLDVMGNMMGEGYWPKKVEKPSSLEDALHLLKDVNGSDDTLTVCYSAFVRNHSMEGVLPLMKSLELETLMLELYTTEELMPHLRTGLVKSGRVKGKVLEDGLGL
mgnify:FL=1